MYGEQLHNRVDQLSLDAIAYVYNTAGRDFVADITHFSKLNPDYLCCLSLPQGRWCRLYRHKSTTPPPPRLTNQQYLSFLFGKLQHELDPLLW